MNKNETSKILATISAAYPRFQVDNDGTTLNVWFQMLGDLDYSVCSIAVGKLIMESPYPPAISDIRKYAAEIMTSEEDKIDSAKAWGEVVEAIKAYGYYRRNEALASMSPLTAKVVNYMGWSEICLSERPDVVRGQFLKMYETVASREKEERLLPERLKQQIRNILENVDAKKMLNGGDY